jgi:hypothetical protein
MNTKKIHFTTPNSKYTIPTRWELLTPSQYLFLCGLISEFAAGNATQGDVQLHFICKMLGVNPIEITDADAMANLIILSEQIDFIFDENGKVNISFLAQLMPNLKANGNIYRGYEVNTSFDTLTSSLVTKQFIDAQEVLKSNANNLPLLAAILYCPKPYAEEKAHKLAKDFANINLLVLHAIALNFQALVTFLFTKTHFSLLAAGKKTDPIPEIATGLAETMYNLSNDGLGDIETIKQMPMIEFLTILRKKLIESVKTMHDAKIDIVEIASKTGLSTGIIKKMI